MICNSNHILLLNYDHNKNVKFIKANIFVYFCLSKCFSMDKKDFRIIFMGTPDFAAESLKILTENDYNIIAVVTNPDKPAGRGQKIKESAVKKYAVSKGLYVLQPSSLKDEHFQESIRKL